VRIFAISTSALLDVIHPAQAGKAGEIAIIAVNDAAVLMFPLKAT
jgi:hypothetical protein